METRPPTTTRILIAVGFALSCFGLALFLWLAFGGPIPLKPEGYRFQVPFDEATQLAVESDVRISGVSVGKVKAVQLSDAGDADAEIEMDPAYAPIPEDTRAILRQKTLLGETYVELTPGSDSAPSLPEGGSLPAAQVADSVQLDEIFRTFDARTRAAFQAWMQGAAAAFRGRGDDLSITIASLDPFAEETGRLLRLLDSQQSALSEFLRQGGQTFEALSNRPGQLRGTIENSAKVFATTAARDQDLTEIFRIFPTFLRESRATLTRLEQFSRDADPVVTALYPAARELQPTLAEVQNLTPVLGDLFPALAKVIPLAPKGFGATRKLLGDSLPPLLKGFDPWLADFNSILQVLGMYKQDVTSLVANVAAASQGVFFDTTLGKSFHYLRTEAPLAPEAVSTYPHRLSLSRTNPYFKPGGLSQLRQGLKSFEVRQCSMGVSAFLDPNDPNDPNFNARFGGDVAKAQAFFDRLKKFAFDDQLNTDSITPAPCNEQSDYDSVGVSPQQTQYLHVREQP
ncbi:MAG: phospholipid/cholesterol/gamma-HCH transport system substrate-binding protein [Solirubrobacterales bacterium]|jgi:ABC-type transporter Mla subunit MlaD|nr:phospholipid/cholesterol/gamma-HCH transport system substrate-binding protein [Solirubrobacterales bacterium]